VFLPVDSNLKWLNDVSCLFLSANLIKYSVRLAARQVVPPASYNCPVINFCAIGYLRRFISPVILHPPPFLQTLCIFINVYQAAEALRVGRRVLQLAVPDDPGGQPAAERHSAGGRGLWSRHHPQESPGGRGLPTLTLPPLSRGHGAQTAAGSSAV
jgi:hypothetical protein